MKKILALILLLTNCAFAQKGLVYYGFIDARGMGDANGPDSNAYLVFNKEQSYYVTAKDSLENNISKNESKTYTKEGESGGLISLGAKATLEGDQVAYHIKKNTMWSNMFVLNQIYTKEVAPKINWKISKETKKIGKFTSKKATANFRRRDYTAWFTTEISLPYGPWKLHGLPGLILEAYDSNKNAYWYFKSVEYPSKTKQNANYMSIPKGLKWLSYQEFKKAQQNEINLADDNNKLNAKKFPGVQFLLPKLTDMFLECE